MTVKRTMVSTVVAISLLLGLLGFAVDYQWRGYGALHDGQTLIRHLEAEVLQLRRDEKDFLARKDEKYIEQFGVTHAGIEKTLSDLLAKLNELSIDAARVSGVQAKIADYGVQFKAIADSQIKIGLEAGSGLYGELRSAVHEAEAVVKTHADHEMQSRLLMLRRAEKDFMLRRDPKYVVKFENDFHSLKNIVSRAELPDADHQKLVKALGSYRQKFLSLVEAEKDIGLTHTDGKLGGLRQTVHEVETELTSLSQTLNKEIDAAAQTMKWTLYAAIIGIIFAAAAMLSWIAYRISKRARRAAYSMQQVAAGDGDLTRRLDAEGSDEFAELGHSFNLFATKIHDLLKRVAELTTTLSQTSSKVTDAAYATKDSMVLLRENTQSVVVASEEMSATAQEVAGSASRVSVSTHEADAIAAEGKNTVEQSIVAINSFAEEFNEAAETITSLRGETENIGSILDVIRGISEQTNLLALNAAIEAARAGEQGRGFAVVADEVRTLAHRSHESTSEIQQLIERLQAQAESAVVKIQSGHERIKETVAQAQQAGTALGRITASVGSITDMTTQIATAAEEQSVVVADISNSVSAIDGLALQTANSAQGTTELTAELERAMAAVTQELRQFRFASDEQLILAQARSAHLNWKARLRAFLDGEAALSSEQVVSHHHCDLGKWYDSAGKEDFGERAEFRAIENPHERIHAAIRQVVELREKGDRQAAEAAFVTVEALSAEIVERLDTLASALKQSAEAPGR